MKYANSQLPGLFFSCKELRKNTKDQNVFDTQIPIGNLWVYLANHAVAPWLTITVLQAFVVRCPEFDIVNRVQLQPVKDVHSCSLLQCLFICTSELQQLVLALYSQQTVKCAVCCDTKSFSLTFFLA